MPATTSDMDVNTEKRPLFRDLKGDDDDPEISVIESLCLNCEEQGTTKLLLTKIPYFKEIIVSSFECPHCGAKNTEVQPASVIQDKGIKIELKVCRTEDLNRQVVKQHTASYVIPKLEFEAPPFASKGVLTTVEGLLTSAVEDLEHNQPVRRIMEPEIAASIDVTISKLKDCLSLKEPFSLHLNDISGNSFIENPFAPSPDPQASVTHYFRTNEESEKLGIFESQDDANAIAVNDERTQTTGEVSSGEAEKTYDPSTLRDEVLEFQVNCPSCLSPSVEKMKTVAIPHFKEVVIMAADCDVCGHKSNEVKAGGGIEEFGTKITLKMTHGSDLSRDVLKSDTCRVEIPEFELEAGHGTLGGKFTTLEGLLVDMRDQLKTSHPFQFGDSADDGRKEKLVNLINRIDKVISGEMMVTIILDDPVGNSYMQNPYAPDKDPSLTTEKYTRSHEQNEELGLNDIVCN